MDDSFGRPTKNIRISVTEGCNLNCYYCHNEGQVSNGTTMTPDEIETILRLAAGIGIKKVKFTGGEPLLRADILEIVTRASRHMKDVSMTTNGAFPAELAYELRAAGLDRANISLDSFNRERFKQITGADKLDLVLEFIKAAIAAGLDPVKINIVALADTQLDDLMETIEEVWNLGGIPQIIELVEMGDNGYSDISAVEDVISSRAVSFRERKMHRRKIYSVPARSGELKEIEFVRPMHNTEFCANCSRIRVMSGGLLKPCLMHNEGLVDILTPMRNGANEDELMELFKSAVMNRRPYWRN